MPELNRKKLSEQFEMDVETVEAEIVNVVKNIKDGDDPDNILKENIKRANGILDKVEEEILNGNFSARMVEVAAKILESITNSASQIQSSNYNNEYLLLREKMVELKKLQHNFKIKQAATLPLPGGQTEKLIITDRESILKILRNNGNINQIQERSEENNGDDNDNGK